METQRVWLLMLLMVVSPLALASPLDAEDLGTLYWQSAVVGLIVSCRGTIEIFLGPPKVKDFWVLHWSRRFWG